VDEEMSDRIEVIGESDDKDLVSATSPISVSYHETLYRAKDKDKIGEPVGTAVATCHEIPGSEAMCLVQFDMNGTGGFRKGRVTAVGTIPVDARGVAPGRGTLTIVGGGAYNPEHGHTLDVEIWNPKKYSQTDP
jgi:hypothetical protein